MILDWCGVPAAWCATLATVLGVAALLWRHHVRRRPFRPRSDTNPKTTTISETPRNKQQLHASENAHFEVAQIFVYPVKSCKGMRVEGPWPADKSGLLFDREWAVVRPNKDGEGGFQFVTGRQQPKLTALEARVESGRLVLRPSPEAGGGAGFAVPLLDNISNKNPPGDDCPPSSPEEEAERQARRLELWGTPCRGVVDCGDGVASFLQSYLGCAHPVRLLRMPRAARRLGESPRWGTLLTDPERGPGPQQAVSRFSDWSPFTLVSRASLEWLSEKVRRQNRERRRWKEGGGDGDDDEQSFLAYDPDRLVNRFRPNFVVEEVPSSSPASAERSPASSSKLGFVEETWNEFDLGELPLRHGRPTTRCAMTLCRPEKGGARDPAGQPLRVLRESRLGRFERQPDERMRSVSPSSNGPMFCVSSLWRHDDAEGEQAHGDPIVRVRVGDRVRVVSGREAALVE